MDINNGAARITALDTAANCMKKRYYTATIQVEKIAT